MMTTWLIAAAVAGGPADPAEPPPPVPVHRVAATHFFIPFHLDAVGVPSDRIAAVELMWSADRGRAWRTGGTAPPADGGLHFRPAAAGEFWFAVRLHPKAGGAIPADLADLRPVLKVAVTLPEPLPVDPAAVLRAERVARLAEQLDRVELELVRGERDRLEKADGFSAATAAAFDLLYDRLARLRGGPVTAAAARLEVELDRLEVELVGKEIEQLGKAKALTPEGAAELDRLRARLREIPLRGRSAEAEGPWVPTPRRLGVPPAVPPQPLPPPNLFPGP